MAADIVPAQDPDGALAFIKSTLQGFKERQGELEVWFAALSERVAWGVIQCADVVKYNAAATTLYDAQVDFFTWLRPAVPVLEQRTGMVVMPNGEVPLPQLIGTRYLVYERGGRKVFDAGVQCNADGTFSASTPRAALQIAPSALPADCATSGGAMNGTFTAQLPMLDGRSYWSPYPTITDMRGQLAGALGNSAQLEWIKTVQLAIVTIIAYIIADVIRSTLASLLGSEVQKLNLQAHNQQIRAESLRQAAINECFKSKIAAAGGATDPQLVQKLYKDCETSNPKIDPPPYGSTWLAGLTGLVVAGGLVAVGVLLVKGRGDKRRSAADE